jgi:biotin carboxyl carrier protein
MAEKYLIRDGGDEVSLELKHADGRTFVRREGADTWRDVQLERIGESGLYLLMVDSQPTELYLERRRGGAIVTIGRHIFDYDVAPWRPASTRTPRATAGASGTIGVTAPMTGSIIEVRCLPGDVVQKGQVLVVIESMKMNNELRAPASGKVESVPVEPGQRVNAGDLLVALEA